MATYNSQIEYQNSMYLGSRALMPLLPRYSFGVVSDLHVNSEDNGAPADIERMFRAFENRKVKDVFCCGDITSSHTAAQLSAFSAIKDRHPGVRFCSCNGNHDVGLTDADWQTYIGHSFKHWFMWHNDAFDLANFVYVTVEETFDASKFEGSKIQLFKFSNTDEDGIEGKQFVLAKCFYTKKKDWIDEQVARIKAAYDVNLVDNG